MPDQAEVGTGDIADLLNWSRPHPIKLLNEGRIPSHCVGTHRRARLKGVMAYREVHHKARKTILDRMSAIDQDLAVV
jgi:excisionase family DNA binding protein